MKKQLIDKHYSTRKNLELLNEAHGLPTIGSRQFLMDNALTLTQKQIKAHIKLLTQ